MRLANRVAYITGGASGIGAACAELFASEGAAVAIVDRDHQAAEALAKTIRSSGGTAFTGNVDVTLEQSVRDSLQQVASEIGSADVLVNSAGITARNVPAGTGWVDSWQMVMDVNVKGTMIASTLFCERAIAAGHGGAIVNLSSIYGQVGRPPLLSASPDPYSHSKGAVLQVTRDFAADHAASGIRVNCLCPGFIRTPLTSGLTAQPEIEQGLIALHPMGRLGEAKEVAHCAMFLASDAASYVTGIAMPVDGGYLSV